MRCWASPAHIYMLRVCLISIGSEGHVVSPSAGQHNKNICSQHVFAEMPTADTPHGVTPPNCTLYSVPVIVLQLQSCTTECLATRCQRASTYDLFIPHPSYSAAFTACCLHHHPSALMSNSRAAAHWPVCLLVCMVCVTDVAAWSLRPSSGTRTSAQTYPSTKKLRR